MLSSFLFTNFPWFRLAYFDGEIYSLGLGDWFLPVDTCSFSVSTKVWFVQGFRKAVVLFWGDFCASLNVELNIFGGDFGDLLPFAPTPRERLELDRFMSSFQSTFSINGMCFSDCFSSLGWMLEYCKLRVVIRSIPPRRCFIWPSFWQVSKNELLSWARSRGFKLKFEVQFSLLIGLLREVVFIELLVCEWCDISEDLRLFI